MKLGEYNISALRYNSVWIEMGRGNQTIKHNHLYFTPSFFNVKTKLSKLISYLSVNCKNKLNIQVYN